MKKLPVNVGKALKMVTVKLFLSLVILIVDAKESRSGACPTEAGRACVFPFKTTCMSTKGSACQFPFLYKGKEYTECTLYQSSGNNPWCATSLKADGNMAQWANCVMDVCADPSVVGGPHDKCVTSTTSEGKGWCATAVGEDGFFTTRDFCSDPECVPTPPTTTTTTTTSTTVTTTTVTTTTSTTTAATSTEDSDCGCDIPTECITGFSGSVYNTTEDFMGVADFFTRVSNLIEGGVSGLLNFLIPPTVKPPLLPFGPAQNGTIEPLQTTPGGATAAPGTTGAPAGTTAAPEEITEAPAGTTGTELNRKGLFQDQVQEMILSGERTDCRVLANQITGGALDNALALIGMRNLAILKEGVQEASDRGVLDKVTDFIAKAGIVIPTECVCQCGCQKVPTKSGEAATTAAPAADED